MKPLGQLRCWIVLGCGLVTTATLTAAEQPSANDLQTAETILIYQRASGGWPKNYDRTRWLEEPESAQIRSQREREDSTFDNGATRSELRHLAKIYAQTNDARFKAAFLEGLDFVLAAQYPNGGWPQQHPKSSGYHRHITFNDDAMVGILRLLRDIAGEDKMFDFVDQERRQRCTAAVQRGVACVLQCQVVVDGKKTVWCAQHDPDTLAPAQARSYELASLSGSESVEIVRFLMEIDEPTPQVIDAVQSAVAWFDRAKLTGIKVVRKPDPATPKGWDKVVVNDSSAPPLWARFYRIEDNQPFYCSRDGVPKATLAEISYERRNGYSWLGDRPAALLARDYPQWQRKWAPERNVLRQDP